MTDEEMALDIGKRLIDLEIKIAVLQGTLESLKHPDGTRPNWREMVSETLLEPQFVHIAQERFDQLKTAISEDSSGDPLIRIVHQVVCDR